jgi:hypothetical protein
VTPGVSTVKLAVQETGFNPPDSPPASDRATPSRNMFPPRPVGTVVFQVFVAASNVVAAVAVGEKEMFASGVAMLNAELAIVPWFTWMVTRLLPTPLTFSTLLNQTVEPAAILVPLKFEEIELTVGTIRSSRRSRFSRYDRARRGAERTGGRRRAMRSGPPGHRYGRCSRHGSLEQGVV